MRSLFVEALPFLPLAMTPALLLLLAPFVGPRVRAWFAAGLLSIAALFVVDILVFDHSEVRTLDVPNVFPGVGSGEPKLWIVARHAAPAWAWHVCAAVLYGVFGASLWLRRRHRVVPQHPVQLGAAVFLVYLAVRLALERCAAPQAIVWATGATPALVVLLPFVGFHAGRRGYSLGKWGGALLLIALLQRLPLIAFGYLATTRQLGTHLDTHLVTEMGGAFGALQLDGDAVRTWWWTTAVPQATLAIGVTLVAGLILGLWPWWRGRRGFAASGGA